MDEDGSTKPTVADLKRMNVAPVERDGDRDMLRWRSTAWLPLAIAVLLVLTVQVVPGRTAPDAGEDAGDDAGLALAGKVHIRNGDGHRLEGPPDLLGIDPELHLLVAGRTGGLSGLNDEFTNFDRSELYLIDTRAVEQVGTIDISGVPIRLSSNVAATVDRENHRLFLAGNTGATLNRAPEPGSGDTLAVIDLTGEEPPVVTELEFNDPVTQVEGSTVRALTYEPSTGTLYALMEGQSEVAHQAGPYDATAVASFDVDSIMQGDSSPEWVLPLYGMCPSVPSSRGVSMGASEGYVYLPCTGGAGIASTTFNVGGVPSPIMHGIARIRPEPGTTPSDTSNFEVELFPFGGNLGKGFAIADSHSDLVFAATTGADSQKLYVFDPIRGAWTGAVKLGDANTVGTATDPATRRIYQADSSTGQVLVTEGDRVEVPNGQLYRTDVADFRNNFPPLVDPVTRRIFFKGAFTVCKDGTPPCESADEFEDDSHIRAYQDNLPPAPAPAPVDPDDRTEDVAEEPGETSSSLSGNAQAFGARYTFVGGTGNARVTNPSGLMEDHADPYMRTAPLGASTRDLFFGQAIGASLAASSFGSPQVGASAAGFVPGDQTANDLRRNSDVQCAGSNLASQTGAPGDPGCFFEESDDERIDGMSWPDEFPEELRGHVSLCRVFGGEGERGSKPGSAVNCDPATPIAEAASVFDASEPSPFSVGHAEALTTVTRDPDRGTVSTAEAVARGVDVLGVIRIGEVRTVAEAVAHGRPGTAETSLRREAYQVAIGPPGEEPAFTCGFGQEPCDLYQVAEAINEQFQPRIQATVPPPATAFDQDSDSRSPDEEVSNGTDGGAKATVEIDPYHFQSNRVINSIRQFEVPALTITAYDDHRLPSRHILQLGAVALDANYTVSELPSYDFGPPGFDGGDGGFPSDDGDGGLDLPVQQRAVHVPPFEPLTDAASQTDPGQSVPDPLAAGQQTDVGTTDVGADQATVPGGPAGPVSSGTAPSLSTGDAPVDGGAPAPEVAAPADGDGEQAPQAAEPDQQQAPGGLMLTQQRVSETVPMAALWLLVALPLYLAVRRRGLINTTRR